MTNHLIYFEERKKNSWMIYFQRFKHFLCWKCLISAITSIIELRVEFKGRFDRDALHSIARTIFNELLNSAALIEIVKRDLFWIQNYLLILNFLWAYSKHAGLPNGANFPRKTNRQDLSYTFISEVLIAYALVIGHN